MFVIRKVIEIIIEKIVDRLLQDFISAILSSGGMCVNHEMEFEPDNLSNKEYFQIYDFVVPYKIDDLISLSML